MRIVDLYNWFPLIPLPDFLALRFPQLVEFHIMSAWIFAGIALFFGALLICLWYHRTQTHPHVPLAHERVRHGCWSLGIAPLTLFFGCYASALFLCYLCYKTPDICGFWIDSFRDIFGKKEN